MAHATPDVVVVIGVTVAGVAKVGIVTAFESNVTAACASALPFKVAPVFNTIVV
jgi:hypothetical protein